MPVVTVGSTSPAKKRGPGRKTLAKTLAAATRPATTEPAAPTPTDSLTTFGAAPTVTVLKTRTALEYWEVHVPFSTYAFGQPAPHEADAQEAVEFELAALRRAWIAKHAARHHEVNDERPMQVVCEIATLPSEFCLRQMRRIWSDSGAPPPAGHSLGLSYPLRIFPCPLD